MLYIFHIYESGTCIPENHNFIHTPLGNNILERRGKCTFSIYSPSLAYCYFLIETPGEKPLVPRAAPLNPAALVPDEFPPVVSKESYERPRKD